MQCEIEQQKFDNNTNNFLFIISTTKDWDSSWHGNAEDLFEAYSNTKSLLKLNTKLSCLNKFENFIFIMSFGNTFLINMIKDLTVTFELSRDIHCWNVFIYEKMQQFNLINWIFKTNSYWIFFCLRQVWRFVKFVVATALYSRHEYSNIILVLGWSRYVSGKERNPISVLNQTVSVFLA